MTDPLSGLPPSVMDAVRAHRGRFRNVGIVMIAVGVLAILFPLVFSVVAKVALGWVFLITGAVLLWHTVQSRGWRSGLLAGVIALMHLALGVYLAFFALTGLVGLTLLLGAVFLMQGVAEGMIAIQHRPEKGWGWLAVNGIVTLALGFLLIAGLPGTALWAVGVMLGVNFVSTGIAMMALSRV
jgi:uncharacterized membrane protein HdeD (DUF308 family)